MSRLDNGDSVNVDFPDVNSFLFAKRMFATGFQVYTDKLKSLGMSGFDSVLDAGCGYGQWIVPLSYLNKNVVGIDISENRVNFLEKVLQDLNLTNTAVNQGSVTLTRFLPNTFEAVFSYGVVFCTPWRQTLTEFHRILAPGGRLYFNFPSIDWYIFLWHSEHNKSEGYSPRSVVAEAFANYIKYQNFSSELSGQVIMDPSETTACLESLGFINIEISKEGMLRKIADNQMQAVWETNGKRGLYEVIAEKPR